MCSLSCLVKRKSQCCRRHSFAKGYFSSYFSLHLFQKLTIKYFKFSFFTYVCVFFSVVYCNGCSFFSCSSSIYSTSLSGVSCSIFSAALLLSSSYTTFLYCRDFFYNCYLLSVFFFFSICYYILS